MFKRISNVQVRAIKLLNKNTLPVKGEKLITNPYSNVFICARKRSGKTCLIAKILRSCTDRKTHVVIICSTAHKDATYQVIIQKLRKRGITVDVFDSLLEGKRSIIDDIIDNYEPYEDQQSEDDEEQDDEPIEKPPAVCDFGECSEPEDDLAPSKPKRKPWKRKKLAPDLCIVLDDMGTQLRHKSVGDFMKKNRHFKCLTLVSSQYPQDLSRQSFKNLDRFIAFQGHSKEKMKEIHTRLDISFKFDKFYEMYKTATEKKYNFLYVDVEDDRDIRKNFNDRFI